jgi:hypothetical protein
VHSRPGTGYFPFGAGQSKSGAWNYGVALFKCTALGDKSQTIGVDVVEDVVKSVVSVSVEGSVVESVPSVEDPIVASSVVVVGAVVVVPAYSITL